MIRVIVDSTDEQEAVTTAAMGHGLNLFGGHLYQVIRQVSDGRQRLVGQQTHEWTEVEHPAQGDTGPGVRSRL